MGSRVSGTFLVLFGSLAIFGPDLADACGDKLVGINQGVRFQRAAAVKAGTILIFAEEGSAKAVKELQSSLRRVGHDIEVVADLEGIEQALETTRYDLVIAALPEVARLATLMSGMASPPQVVPFVRHADGAARPADGGQYPFVLSLPSKANEQILIVDRAMKARAAAAPAKP